MLIAGGESPAMENSISVSHGSIILRSSDVGHPITAQNTLNRIREPVVEVEPECAEAMATM